MSTHLEKVVSVAYASTGLISAIGYMPTLIDLYNKKSSANLRTYSIWLVGSFITMMYSFCVMDDNLFRIMSMGNFTMVTLVFFMLLRIKHSPKTDDSSEKVQSP
jgi:uncharacterized protein with PQ loop repeat